MIGFNVHVYIVHYSSACLREHIKPVLLEVDCMQEVVAEWDKAVRRGGRKQERDMYGYIVQNTRMW